MYLCQHVTFVSRSRGGPSFDKTAAASTLTSTRAGGGGGGRANGCDPDSGFATQRAMVCVETQEGGGNGAEVVEIQRGG